MNKKAITEFFKQYDKNILNTSGYYQTTNHSVIYIPDSDYVIGYTIDLSKKLILELQKEKLHYEVLDEFEIDGVSAFKYRLKKLRKLSEMHEAYVKQYFIDILRNIGANDDYRKLEYVRPFTNTEFNKIIDLIYMVKPSYLDMHLGQFLLDENNDIVLIDCEYSEKLARKTERVVAWYDEKHNS